jgi:AcrR family transcriptional regulator
MTTEEKNTKQKILEVADSLFAKNGFEGTSVRDIATMADVNLAAINYHFKNKENLYWKVFDYNYEIIQSGIEEVGKEEISTAELACEVLKFFINNGSAITNTFKIFFAGNIAIPDESIDVDKEEHFGPPGQKVFFEKIKNDLDGNVTDNGRRWATKMIFSQLVHFGVVLNTPIMKSKCQTELDLSPEAMGQAIYHSAQAHLAYLKNNPDIFS